ncbi:MAG: MFS transporter [Chloroflexi bacterium]|nr:MFS transporter [Chloroflexota bacterium]
MASGLTIGSSQYAFGLFVGPLEETFGWSRTQISASLSFTAVGSLIAPLLGRFMDKHGARPVLAFSLTLICLSFALRPLMSELWHWYALSLLQFVGYSGATILPAGRLIGIWFSRNRGRVMGITMLGNNFGGLWVPPVLALTLSMSSWRGSYVVLAVLTALVLIYAMVVLREYPKADDSEADGRTMRPQETSILTGWTLKEALHTKAFYAIATAVLMGSFTYSAVLPQVTAHLTNEGVSVTVASLALSVFAIFGMLGKLAMGFLSERIGSRYALMVDLGGQTLFVLVMMWAATPAVMWLSVPMFGFFLGGFGALFSIIIQDMFGIRHFGSIMGIINMATMVSFGVGPLLAGASFDLTGSYRAAFMITAVLFAIGALALTQARLPSKNA